MKTKIKQLAALGLVVVLGLMAVPAGATDSGDSFTITLTPAGDRGCLL